MSSKFRRLTDLFVQGKAVPLPDESGYLWVQVINSYERDECVSDAQTARARLILALKNKGDERTKVEAHLQEVGFDTMASDLAQSRADAKMSDFTNEMRDDPEWKERMEIILKTDWDESATAPTEAETLLLAKINGEVMTELGRRQQDEIDFLMRKYKRMTDDEFIDEWVEEWLDRKGTAVAGAEYRLTEAWFSARFCDAPFSKDGDIDHSKCGGHRDRVFETKADARAAPQLLFDLIRSAIDDLAMESRDPKGSGSAASSSDLSPTPNAPEASTPSTSTGTPPAPPGT